MRKRILSLITAICMLCGLVLNGTVLPVSASETDETVLPAIPFTLNFEDGADESTGLPKGWVRRNAVAEADTGKNAFTVEVDPDEEHENNHAAKLAQTAATSEQYQVEYHFEPTSQALVLEYRFFASGTDIYLPTLAYDDANDSTMCPLSLRFSEGYIYRKREVAPGPAEWSGKVEATANTWHDLKLIVDIQNKKFDALLDGTSFYASTLTKQHAALGYVTTSIGNTSASAALYIDDLKVRADGIDTEAELKAAIEAGQAEITLTGDITITEKITVTKDVKLIANEGVTITTGRVDDAFTVDAGGVLTLGSNISVSCVLGAFWVQNGGKLVIDGASIRQSGADYEPVAATGTGSLIEMKSGSVVSESSSAIAALNGSVVNISGGTVTSAENYGTYATGGATINVSGGTVTNGVADKPALIAAKFTEATGGNVNVTGGTVKGVLAHEAANATATISGGTITGPVGVGDGNVGKLSISGGTFTNTDNISDYLEDGFKLDGDTVVTDEGTAIPKFPFEVNFEDGADESTGLPKGWVRRDAIVEADKDLNTFTVAVDPEDENNHAAKLTQTAATSKQNQVVYHFEPTNQFAVLEYRFFASGTDIYLPTLAYDDANGSTMCPLSLRFSKGYIYRKREVAPGPAEWSGKVEATANTWHDLKLIVDIQNKKFDALLDGTSFYASTLTMQHAALSYISASIGNTSESAALYIDDLKVTGPQWAFTESSMTMHMGEMKALNPVFTPANVSTKITYSSSDETVATVDAAGVVFGVKEGTATITATSDLPNLDPIQITVNVGAALQGTIIAENELEMPVGGHDFLAASIEFEDGVEADTTLKYASSAPEVATVDEYGEVLAVGVGEATITISSKVSPAIKKTVTVTVSVPEVVKKIYVAPNGTAGHGTSANDPTTLEDALIQLAAIDKDNMSGNIEVILADGYYYRTETLKLNETHGGSNLYSVIFKAAEGANPTIGGGVSIEGSKFADANNDGIYEYDLSGLNLGDDFNTRQLYVDNVRAVRASSEKKIKGTVLENAQYLYDTDRTTLLGFVCDNTELLAVKRPQDMDFVWKNNWINSRYPVATIEEVDGRVHVTFTELALRENDDRRDFATIKPSNVCWYENALEILDVPGEWYYNKETKVLYYMPRAWETMADVTVTLPVFDNWDKADNGNVGLITVIGSSTEKQVQNIRFEGITFADVTWLRPDTMGLPTVQNNYVDGLAGKYSQGHPDAAITVKMANSIDFLNCTFTRLGSNGINMYDGVQNSLIQGCHFYDISAGAIGIGQPNYTTQPDNFNPTDPLKMMKNDDVLNNYIHDIGVDYKSASAISVGFAVDLDLCHNEIFNIPYSGFHIGYGWDTKFDSVTKNLNVSQNFIHDLMYEGLYDGGAVYLNGATAGSEDNYNILSENYVRNQGAMTAMLYGDDGTSWWKYTKNVTDLSEKSTYQASSTLEYIRFATVKSTNCYAVRVIDNYTTHDVHGNENANRLITYENTTVVEDLNWPAEAQAIIDASGLEAAYAGLRNNQAERIVTAAPEGGVSLKAGGTFNIQLRATDGKDKAVSLEDATVAYESLDETIATVDANGVITGVAYGQATVRVHVVSNDIWDIIEIEVFVDDEVTELHLRNAGNRISLFEDSAEKQLVAYGVTEAGREASFETVTWSIDDDTVATVDANGVLKPVALGETTLTVTGAVGGYEVTATFRIVVQSEAESEVDYLEDIFLAANEDKWNQQKPEGSWELVDGEKITTSFQFGKVYTGRKFQNELLTFRMSVIAYGTWPSIALRMPDETCAPGLSGSGYIFGFGKNGIELHRFNDGDRTQWYGPEANPKPLKGPAIEPNPLNNGELHEIQVGAINEAGGVRLVLYIDGVEIINVLDDQEGALTDAGYFGLVGWKKTSDGVTNYDTFVLEKLDHKFGYAVDESGNVVKACQHHGCDETTELTAPEIYGKSISLKDNIVVNYYTVIPTAMQEDPNTKMIFTLPDPTDNSKNKVIEIPVTDATPQTKNGIPCYVFRCEVSAKEMGDQIQAHFVYGDNKTTEVNYYSVEQYAQGLLNDSEQSAYAELINATLLYGALAQKHFGYKTDDTVADVSNVDFSSFDNTKLDGFKNTGSGASKAKFYGTSLLLKSETILRVFFQVDEGATLTVKNGNTVLEVKQRNGLKYVDVENIPARKLGETITLKVSDGTDEQEIKVSPLGYCYNVLRTAATTEEEKTLHDLVKALFLYYEAAKAVLGQ